MNDITDLRDELEDCAAEAAMIGAAISTLNEVDDEELRCTIGVFASRLSVRLARLSDHPQLQYPARAEPHPSGRVYLLRQAQHCPSQGAR